MGNDDSLFRDICEHAQDLIQSVDLDGRFAYANPAWQAALGYGADDLAELHFLDILHPDSHEHCVAIFERVVRGEDVLRIATTFVTRAGREFPVEGSVSARRDGDGNVVATCGIFRDVSEKERARAEVDRLFELSLDLLCVAGTDGFFRRVNPAFERALGYEAEELLSKAFVEFVHPDDREQTGAAMEQLRAGKPVVDFQNRYRAHDGSWRWLAWRSSPPDEGGNIYAVARDITEERRTQDVIAQQAADLERSNEDLEEFAYAASHDLQAPLRAIGNLAEWIGEDLDAGDRDRVHEHVTAMRERVEQMQQLVDDLLAYSRAGRISEDAQETDVAELLERVIRLLAPREGLEVSVEPGMPVLRTPRTPLEQVFRNLISNALAHHDRDTGTVTIGARRADDAWEFSVADDGPGVPEADQHRIFQMFQRLDGSGSHGTGMGLALVGKIVERFGGRVWVESGPGRGSVFRFTWPDVQPTPED